MYIGISTIQNLIVRFLKIIILLYAQCYIPRNINRSNPYRKIFIRLQCDCIAQCYVPRDINRSKPYPKIFKDYNVIVLLNVIYLGISTVQNLITRQCDCIAQ